MTEMRGIRDYLAVAEGALEEEVEVVGAVEGAGEEEEIVENHRKGPEVGDRHRLVSYWKGKLWVALV